MWQFCLVVYLLLAVATSVIGANEKTRISYTTALGLIWPLTWFMIGRLPDK